MGRQICFFEKSFLDFDNESATISASENSEFAKYMRSRSLRSAWLTTDSLDIDNPTVEFDLASTFHIDTFLLLDHNLKSFRIDMWNFITEAWELIFETEDELSDTTEITLPAFYGQRFQITCRGTQTPDQDKRINRIIVTKKLGQFSHWPKIESPVLDQGKTARKTLSGKVALLRTVGAFKCRLTLSNWRNQSDLELVERIYRQVQGFEVWFSGGDENQFFYASEGYRARDLYLMGIANDLSLEHVGGIYQNGFKVALDLVEVVS